MVVTPCARANLGTTQHGSVSVQDFITGCPQNKAADRKSVISSERYEKKSISDGDGSV